MSSLSPPSECCSTLRSPLSIPSRTLGRRRSTSHLTLNRPLNSSPEDPSSSVDPPDNLHDISESESLHSEPEAPSSSPSSSYIPGFMYRVFHWTGLHPKHQLIMHWFISQSSQDTQEHEDESDLSLPLPASATKASFGDVLDQKPPKSSLQSRSGSHSHWPSVHFPLFLVITLFPISTILVFISLRTLPISVSWPRTLTDLATLGRELHGYSQSGTWPLAHVVGVMAITAIWKHAWSIPGSVIWNVLAGALFSPAFATILLTLLTTIGSLCATLLAAPLAPFITHFFPKALDMTRSALEGDVVTATVSETDLKTSDSPPSSSHTSGAWVRLSILRLVGVVPWSGINIACGVCRVPLIDCLLGSFIGTLPWTAVTCQIGDILQTVASQPSPTPQTVSSLLVSPEIITKLVILSFLSLAPILAKDHLKALIASAPASASAMIQQEERKPRWSWKGVKEWKVRLPSRSRTRSRARDQLQLDLLIDEKRQIQMQDEALALPS